MLFARERGRCVPVAPELLPHLRERFFDVELARSAHFRLQTQIYLTTWSRTL